MHLNIQAKKVHKRIAKTKNTTHSYIFQLLSTGIFSTVKYTVILNDVIAPERFHSKKVYCFKFKVLRPFRESRCT